MSTATHLFKQYAPLVLEQYWDGLITAQEAVFKLVDDWAQVEGDDNEALLLFVNEHCINLTEEDAVKLIGPMEG